MLDQQEMSNRFDFYRTVFGEDRMRSSIFPDKLWPVSSYDRKIRGLTERGFKDPRKMIASLPAVLGLSFENIDRKMKLCRRLNVCIDDFIACTIVFIGMSAKHYIPILRKCRELGLEPTPRTVFKVYRSKTF